MLIYGAGGHAKVIISLLRNSGTSVKAIFDDDPAKRTFEEISVTGSYDPDLHVHETLILAIGDNAKRAQLAAKIVHRFENVFHYSSLIDRDVRFGLGNVILHCAVIQTDAIIGNHCIINTSAIIEHECKISDFVHIAPGSVLCGNVTVGECTLIGAGSVVVPNVVIGKNCLIGAGSVVTKNIPDGVIVRGNPARIITQTHYGKENLALATAYGRHGNDLHSAGI
ncbi:acetyltransferase [Dyadobacter psychrophilus]|uniref:Sugar O-acyltransferase, sialic acid O-acetyltransferase NeuD family n=1 Tax=Dyadobacter psychrophilus TaxID=651661 RepID=A0A1T5GPN9_9BACT|nr:acetyltransferase [Dyadobacter psychrophilus]SKC10357.1 sugar O-acyltransferase, sialic acid O-acetyltransferase NeuD family [Dyadobacter psychrophilus]